MRVLTEGDKLRAIGKTIDKYDAESIGFLRFSPDGAELFVRYVEAALRQPEGLKRWYLSVIDQIARETGRVNVQAITGFGWAEMDFPADMARNLALTERWAARAMTG
jgi:choline kinase